MTLKIGNTQSSNINPTTDISGNSEKDNLQSNTAAENEAAIAFLANNGGATKIDNTFVPSDEKKTVGDFLRKIRVEQPFDEKTLAEKKIRIFVEVKKPTNQTTVGDYDKATWRAIFTKAGYAMLTDAEIAAAVGGMNQVGWKVNDTGFSLSNLRTEDAKPGAMVMTTTQGLIEKAKRAGQAVLQYQEYKAKQTDLAIEKGKNYSTEAMGGFLQPIVNAPVNIANGISEPFRAGEKAVLGTSYLPEMPKMTIAERSEYWNKDGRMIANKAGEIAATVTFGGVAGSKAIATQTGRALLGAEAGYNIGAGLAGKDITQTDAQGNARQMEWTERGLRVAGGILGARQTIKTEISTPNSAVNKLDDIFKNPPIGQRTELAGTNGLRINSNTFDKPFQTADDLILEARSRTNGDYANKKFPLAEHAEKIKAKYPSRAEEFDEIVRKYPNGVKFNEAGFPEFSPYSVKTVKIHMKGNRTTDFTAANKAAGLKTTPDNYTWHHHQDRMTMELVPSDLHEFIRHDGGVSEIKKFGVLEW